MVLAREEHIFVSLRDPVGLQVILFDYGNLDRTGSDGKVE